MRPRVFPAEDLYRVTFYRVLKRGFNEAAGIPRGRRPGSENDYRARVASMRPRVFPAEDLIPVSTSSVVRPLQ